MIYRAIVNFCLQGLNLVSKLVLLILMGRFLSVSDVGVFGLLVGTQNLAMYGLGLGFSSYSYREILKRAPADIALLLRDQSILHACAYLVIFPCLLIIFVLGVLPWTMAGWFYALLILEHVNQEVQRLFLALSWTTRATCLIFLRHAAWVYGLAGIVFASPESVGLHTVLGCWTAGEVASLILASRLYNLPWKPAAGVAIDWCWLRKGLRVALPLLGSSLAFSGMGLADRYALQAYQGSEQVGVYTFYSYVRNAIQSLIEIGLWNLYQPRVVAASQNGNHAEYRRLLLHLLVAVGGAATGLCLLAALLIHPVALTIGKPIYGQHLDTFWLVLLLTIVASLVNVPLLAFYARHRDRLTLALSLFGLNLAILFNWLLVPVYGLNGAALATLVAYTLFGATSLGFLRRER
jgi:O-antigen/teichoic acid export membrane protein